MDDNARWNEAYLRFESPEEELRKFTGRLRQAGVEKWDRKLEVLELFAGRGGGMRAWESLGFTSVSGLDISAELLGRYRGGGSTLVADARSIPLPDGSKDVVSVQGGLHHLPGLADLEKVLSEVARVLRPAGRFVVTEPWLTPFLRIVHEVCKVRVARALSPRIDALATMIELERPLYHRWLDNGPAILEAIGRHFDVQDLKTGFGKLSLVARPRLKR